MRILIISRTPWDISNSFGNTFSNLFGGMSDVQIFHICCQHGNTTGTLAERTFQMTDKSVMKSILKRRSGAGWEVISQKCENVNSDNSQVSENAAKKRKITAYIIRDIIWKLGAWKKDKGLCEFLKESNPDIVYLPIYSSIYMCDVQSYIVKKLKTPVVGHISDDVFAINNTVSPLEKVYKKKLHKKLRALIGRCEYLEVFAENMKEEYEKALGKQCYVIGKGIDISEIPEFHKKTENDRRVHFVYTGNIGNGRYGTLYEIGKALSKKGGAVLDIYSGTALTDEMKKLFEDCECIAFHGSVPAEKIGKIQKSADWLVHVEGFTDEIIDSTRMSFSTKLIDYMMSARPIFAVGDGRINSINVLKSHNMAVVADSENRIYSAVYDILEGAADVKELNDNVKNYLVKERDISTIQGGIKVRLQNLISQD